MSLVFVWPAVACSGLVIQTGLVPHVRCPLFYFNGPMAVVINYGISEAGVL